MKKSMLFVLPLLLAGIIMAGCGKNEGGGKPSAKDQLSKLPPANVSDPEVLANAVGQGIAFSQMGMDLSTGMGMGAMTALKSLRIPLLKGKQLVPFQQGEPNCSGTQDHFTCTQQCSYGGTTTMECSGNQTSGSCKITYSNCKESSDEPAANGTILIEGKGDSSGNGTFTISIDITMGEGYVYGSFNISVTSSGTGATVKETIDITGADYADPSDVGFIYFDETINIENVDNYNFTATVNGNGGFGTTKEGKVDIAINNVVIHPAVCWMEPLSGTVTVSAGSASVTVTFDGGSGGGTPPANCNGKVMCSGSYNGEIDITGTSEPMIGF